MNNYGKLFLIPVPLGDSMLLEIPLEVKQLLPQLTYFIAERAKTARHFIKKMAPTVVLQNLIIEELTEETTSLEYAPFLNPALEGHSIGLMSEAGCPGVADPGANVVALAHKLGIEVVPLVGPSSILLSLMASGMNGQRFCFHGYLPVKSTELPKELKRLEQESLKLNQTQIFIETPYRNKSMIEQAFQHLAPRTRFCIACDLTLPTQYVATFTIADWKKQKLPDFHKRPTVFLLLG
jgi:16S rRNA (cytidine1402-2'-O)-methyltransferase